MKMANYIVGSFKDLHQKAVTGSVIELGTHPYDQLQIYDMTMVIQRGDFFFLIDENGQEKEIGDHFCSDWQLTNQGLVINRRWEFFRIDTRGERKSLEYHRCQAWYAMNQAIVVRRDEHFFMVNENGKEARLDLKMGEVQGVAFDLLIIKRGDDFFGIDYQQKKHLFGFHPCAYCRTCGYNMYICRDGEFIMIEQNGREKSLGVHTSDRRPVIGPGSRKLFIVRGNEFYFIDEQGQKTFMGHYYPGSDWYGGPYGIIYRHFNDLFLLVAKTTNP